jgi:hypothetical protein
MDWGTVVAAVITVGGTGAVALYTRHVSKRVPKMEVGDAYQQALSINKEAIAELRGELAGVRDELAAERQESRRLRLRVSRLERVITEAGLPLPNGVEP